MTASAFDQPPRGVGQLCPVSYASLLKPAKSPAKVILEKTISYLHGDPIIQLEKLKVDQIVANETLQYVVVGKFSYGWPDITDLRRLIPKFCEQKGECKIGLLSNRHVLIKATLLEDYIHLLSKPAFYIMFQSRSYPVRILNKDPLFNPKEETSTNIAWISFRALPPNFFREDTLFSLAAIVGKPLQVDLATKNRPRPSCTRVKVEVNLLNEFPKRIKICVKNRGADYMEK